MSLAGLFGTKRKLKNVILTRKFHMRYYGLWFLISIIMVSFLAFSFYLVFEEQWKNILYLAPDMKLEYWLKHSRFVDTLVLISSLLAMALTCLGIFTTHRIAGPLVKLQRAFEEVKKGNLSYRIKFRKQDSLIELELTFNEMMEELEKRLSK